MLCCFLIYFMKFSHIFHPSRFDNCVVCFSALKLPFGAGIERVWSFGGYFGMC